MSCPTSAIMCFSLLGHTSLWSQPLRMPLFWIPVSQHSTLVIECQRDFSGNCELYWSLTECLISGNLFDFLSFLYPIALKFPSFLSAPPLNFTNPKFISRDHTWFCPSYFASVNFSNSWHTGASKLCVHASPPPPHIYIKPLPWGKLFFFCY